MAYNETFVILSLTVWVWTSWWNAWAHTDWPWFILSSRGNSGNNTPSMHHPRRRNVTTSMVGLKTVTYAKISPKMVNPRNTAGEHRRRSCVLPLLLGSELFLHDCTLQHTEQPYWFSMMVHYSIPSSHIGSAQWYTIAHRAAILVQHDGTLQHTEQPYWFSMMVHYSIPSSHIGSAQWYTIAHRAAILVQRDGTL